MTVHLPQILLGPFVHLGAVVGSCSSAWLQGYDGHLAVHALHQHSLSNPTPTQAAEGRDQQLIAPAHVGFPSRDGTRSAAIFGEQLKEHATRILAKAFGPEIGESKKIWSKKTGHKAAELPRGTSIGRKAPPERC